MSKPKSKSQQEVFIEEEKDRTSRYWYTANGQNKKEGSETARCKQKAMANVSSEEHAAGIEAV